MWNDLSRANTLTNTRPRIRVVKHRKCKVIHFVASSRGKGLWYFCLLPPPLPFELHTRYRAAISYTLWGMEESLDTYAENSKSFWGNENSCRYHLILAYSIIHFAICCTLVELEFRLINSVHCTEWRHTGLLRKKHTRYHFLSTFSVYK